jgi:hypothetical protein
MPQKVKTPKVQSRFSDGNMFEQAVWFNRGKPSVFTTGRAQKMCASIKADGAQTNIEVDEAVGITKIISHNGGVVFNADKNSYENFQGKDFRKNVLDSRAKFIATFAYLKSLHPTLARIIISNEYMFSQCGGLLKKIGLNSKPYPDEMIGKFLAFEIQLFMEDGSKITHRLDGTPHIGPFQHLDTPSIVYYGDFTLEGFRGVNDWLIANATTHEGVVITFDNLYLGTNDADDPVYGNKGFKYRTAVTDTSEAPDKMKAHFIPELNPYICEMVRMFDATSTHVPKKEPRTEFNHNKGVDVRRIDIVISKELDHGVWQQEYGRNYVSGKISEMEVLKADLRTALFAELVKNDLYIDEESKKPTSEANGYINRVTNDLARFFQNYA